MRPSDFEDVVARIRRYTVEIHTANGGGSGVVWTADGGIVTNSHVVRSRSVEVVLADGRRLRGVVQARDVGRDLALLRVAASALIPATVRSSEGLRAGELLIAVGSPFGVEGAVTCGVVHSAGRFGPPGADEWVQADVWLAPGNSGGPLADVHGRVVGINTLVALGLGLAIPSEVVQRFVRHATAGAEAA